MCLNLRFERKIIKKTVIQRECVIQDMSKKPYTPNRKFFFKRVRVQTFCGHLRVNTRNGMRFGTKWARALGKSHGPQNFGFHVCLSKVDAQRIKLYNTVVKVECKGFLRSGRWDCGSHPKCETYEFLRIPGSEMRRLRKLAVERGW